MLDGDDSVAPFIIVNEQSESNPDCSVHSSIASLPPENHITIIVKLYYLITLSYRRSKQSFRICPNKRPRGVTISILGVLRGPFLSNQNKYLFIYLFRFLPKNDLFRGHFV